MFKNFHWNAFINIWFESGWTILTNMIYLIVNVEEGWQGFDEFSRLQGGVGLQEHEPLTSGVARLLVHVQLKIKQLMLDNG